MVSHDVKVRGVSLSGTVQNTPALLQMNSEDFPARFLTDLGALTATPGSTITTLPSQPAAPVTLYQPVQRVIHVALLQLVCDSVGYPRLDPARVDSAGIVIRRVIRNNGVDDPGAPPSCWMRSADGQFQWVARARLDECDDPDPAKRPVLQSGQPELDRLLSVQSLAAAQSEVWTPAFVAPPEVCEAAGRTFVYGLLPTASSDISTNAPAPPQYDAQTLAASLPTLLQAGKHSAPLPGQQFDYHYMSDDYAAAHGAPGFATFSLALRMMYTVFGAFEDTPNAKTLFDALNKHSVYHNKILGTVMIQYPTPMGEFYRQAVNALIDYDPASGGIAPLVTMPDRWDDFTDAAANEVQAAIVALLQDHSSRVSAPLGRYQDATRLYRMRVFVRLKPHAPGCPAQLVWSKPSDPFRIAAWHESAGRTQAPVPLPDPTDRNFLKNAKPNCSFAVPAALMNAMQGTSLSGLSSGSAGPSGPGIQLNWICGFNIPLITICAFFVLNIFLTLLNLVFFWLPFIKICIPFPLPSPANSGDRNGT